MRRLLLATSAVVLLLLLVVSTRSMNPAAPGDSQAVHQPAVQDNTSLRTLQARYKTLSKQLSQLMPREPYILVDTARNRLYVKRHDEVVLNAIASTGSGTILDKPGESKSQWIFDTPRGEFLVKTKLTNPTWIK
ncbi:MAG: L,D-transpeptidase, partial [Nitrospira sp.]